MQTQADDDWTAKVHQWWNDLNDNRARRAERAELARAHRLTEIYLTPTFAQLRMRLGRKTERDDQGLALMVGVLAQVRDGHVSDSLGAALARKTGAGSRSKMSGLRFRRLLQAEGAEDAFQHLRRAMALLGRQANIRDLAEVCRDWTHPYRGASQRKRLAIDYYGIAASED